MLEWGTILDEELRKWQQSQSGRTVDIKRPGTSSGEPPEKKQKTLDGPHVSDESMKIRFQKGTINALTVAVLKQFLKDKDIRISSTAKKAELVEEVESYFERKT